MASNKLALPVALLLCGLMAIGSLQTTDAEFCPTYDCQVAKYMTCPSSGSRQLFPACNCCFARNMEKGCIIYYNNGTMSDCSKQ
ncbi:uncharacterized protein [Lolium perenne]|uniref:uncharacterized protein n=1 Tax=Lolium perenne TaxID=4522 RepID=UPI0021F547D2|nr:uncharacterized protein LOC127348448 [Lolium perenne]